MLSAGRLCRAGIEPGSDIGHHLAMAISIYDRLMLPVSEVPGIGPALEKKLAARGIERLGDLLLHLPKRYVDDRRITPIAGLVENMPCRVQGVILRRQAHGHGRKRQVRLRLADESGEISLIFFHSAYMMHDARLAEGGRITVRGTPERWRGQWQMAHPQWQSLERFQPGFHPEYAALAGLTGRRVGALIEQALKLLPDGLCSPLDALPRAGRGQQTWPSLAAALRKLHQPGRDGMQGMDDATLRLKSEEIAVYLELMRQKRRRADCPAVALADRQDDLAARLERSLPHPLTPAQHQVWREIASDLASGRRMHRLLQGDVGSGKTWIAALAMARAASSDRQAAMLAPTEVLARQHAESLNQLFAPVGLSVALLTGSTKAAERRKILASLASGEEKLIVGTHALLTEDVSFCRLALALVDEQHRFGVRQRWALTEKGENVHLLGMTATPIPRSLAMALYGDMDLSLMRGMPPGRKPVETRVLAAARMPALLAGMRRILDQQGRIYWIVPRIDEDEDGVSVDQRCEHLSGQFPDAGVAGLHGRMKPADKHRALDAFAHGESRILVSTTVVEVGVNVPEARLIVIEQAEQYGLAQLHQLRGRVGRSDEQGYCILMAGEGLSSAGVERLKLMERCHDGLELAEEDLKMRGAGDAVGTRQSGEAGFRLLDVAGDAGLIRDWHAHLPELEPDERMILFWRPEARSFD